MRWQRFQVREQASRPISSHQLRLERRQQVGRFELHHPQVGIEPDLPRDVGIGGLLIDRSHPPVARSQLGVPSAARACDSTDNPSRPRVNRLGI